MKRPNKKLAFRPETIRNLSESALVEVVGGFTEINCLPKTGTIVIMPTAKCVPPPTLTQTMTGYSC